MIIEDKSESSETPSYEPLKQIVETMSVRQTSKTKVSGNVATDGKSAYFSSRLFSANNKVEPVIETSKYMNSFKSVSFGGKKSKRFKNNNKSYFNPSSNNDGNINCNTNINNNSSNENRNKDSDVGNKNDDSNDNAIVKNNSSDFLEINNAINIALESVAVDEAASKDDENTILSNSMSTNMLGSSTIEPHVVLIKLPQVTVLIVDDSSMNRKVVRRLIEGYLVMEVFKGYELIILEADDGTAAIEALINMNTKQQRIDLVLLGEIYTYITSFDIHVHDSNDDCDNNDDSCDNNNDDSDGNYNNSDDSCDSNNHDDGGNYNNEVVLILIFIVIFDCRLFHEN